MVNIEPKRLIPAPRGHPHHLCAGPPPISGYRISFCPKSLLYLRRKRGELQSTLRIEDVPTVRSMVAQKLREAIMSGTLKPGQRLIERELCEMTGVSRPSIREALRLLEADGLVNTVPHRGPVVSTISLEEQSSSTRRAPFSRDLPDGNVRACTIPPSFAGSGTHSPN